MHHKKVFKNLLASWVNPLARPAILLIMLLTSLLLASACMGAQSPDPPRDPQILSVDPRPLTVVATMPILADMARNVGGERVQVRSLIPPGADVHSFQTTPADSVIIAVASVAISNGAGLDDFLQPVLLGALSDSAVVVVTSQGIAETGLGENLDDPHFWLDPVLAIQYVKQIRDGLIQADPGNAAIYREQAEEYAARLRELDSEVSRVLSQVPTENRWLISYHRAFSHFGRRYDWNTDALVAEDGVAITPSDILRLTQIIKDNGVGALFAEPQFASSGLEVAAQEAQAAVGPIHTGIPLKGPSTYIEMMRFNASSLAEHLR